HTRSTRDWSSDVCSSDLVYAGDTNFANSTSGNFLFAVSQAATTPIIVGSTPVSPTTFGTAVAFTVIVTPTINGVEPTGTLIFKEIGRASCRDSVVIWSSD